MRIDGTASRAIAATILLLSVLAGTRGAMAAADDLRVGLAQIDVTPPVGMKMADNFYVHISRDVHDRLHAKAVVFTQGAEKAAIVICDLTAMSRTVADSARVQAARKTGIPADHMAIGATHTHGGVLYYDERSTLWHEQAVTRDGRDASEPIDYASFLAERCATVIAQAHDRAVPARLAGGVAPVPGLAFNRRFHMKDGTVVFNPGKRNPDIVGPAGPTDPDLHIVLMNDPATGTPRGVLSVFAMHVATYGGDAYGADFPAHLQQGLRQDWGPEFVSLFGEGCAGDVNHLDVASAKPQTSDEEPARIGAILAKAIRQVRPALEPLQHPALAVRSRIVRWPLQEFTAEQVAEARKTFFKTGAEAPPFLVTVKAHKILETDRFRKVHGGSLPMEVRAFRLDKDTAIVTLPHEIFVEIGLAIKKGSPFRNTLVISLCNDVDFYIPTRKAYIEGSYEVVTARVKIGAGEALTEAALDLLRQLH